MSSTWITEELQQEQDAQEEQEYKRLRRRLIAGRSPGFFNRLIQVIEEDVKGMNRNWPRKFDRDQNSHLVFTGHDGWYFAVQSGPNVLLQVNYNRDGQLLEITRLTRTGIDGDLKPRRDYYYFDLDAQDILCVKTKSGDTLYREDLPKEMLRFILKLG